MKCHEDNAMRTKQTRSGQKGNPPTQHKQHRRWDETKKVMMAWPCSTHEQK